MDGGSPVDAPKSDLVVGIVGAIALTGLVVGLFVVDTGSVDESPETDEGPVGDDMDTGDGVTTDWENNTLNGTVPAGTNLPDSEEGEASDSQTFNVPSGTYQIQIGFEFDTSTPGNLDCHLYDPEGTKLGDEDCHQGTPDSPQGANFTLQVNASQVGEWEFEAHTGEAGSMDLDFSNEKDYTVWIARAIQL